MRPLTRLYAVKMYRQKLIYIFFACFFTASFFYAFLISTPQMEEMLNIDIGMVGRENFPEFMMRFYVGTVGILFQVFLLTLFLCEEDRNRMLCQPLLHGESRSRMMQSKICVAISIFAVSLICFMFVVLCSIGTGFFFWGNQIFGAYLSYFDFMYYLYAFSGYNGAALTGKIILSGVLVNLITGTLLIYGIRRRTDRLIL